jgi:C-terminal processing protease CtpA/Prc
MKTATKKKAAKARKTRKPSAETAPSTSAGAAQTLPQFLATAGQLTTAQRELIVDQALVLIQDLYVHLPLKRAMHAIDPVQRLRLLRKRLGALSERRFHDELIGIFTELRDLHTNYVLPDPFNSRTAFLPFLLEEFFENGARGYVVSKVFAGFSHPTFKEGARVLSWSGIPVERAVELNADRNAGSNQDARHARGLEAMTIRPMAMSLPPDEEWAIIGYRSGAQDLEIKLEWRVFLPDPPPNAVNPASLEGGGASLGIDLLTERVRWAKKSLFAPKAVRLERAIVDAAEPSDVVNMADTSTMPDVLAFRTVTTPQGTFGYLRIWTFSVNDADAFIGEVTRILGLLPQNGLIIDVRGNGGGLILAGERLLQLLTPNRIVPERLHFVNTELTLRLVRGLPFLADWLPSMEQALETGSDFSQGFPVEPEKNSNLTGQKYHGPVVLITDALCYSTTDIFSAGFQDHDIGPILGVSGNTGAGGANVWDHDLLLQFLPSATSPIQPLPNNAGMRVAIRRTTRVGRMSGVPLEDLGVIPDVRHQMTLADLFEDNKDLIGRAAQLLSQRPAFLLSANLVQGPPRKLDVTTKGLNRLDVFINGRPHVSVDLVDGSRSTDLPAQLPANPQFRLEGYSGGTMVAARRL